MKIFKIIILLLPTILSTQLYADKIVAVVNKEAITLSQVKVRQKLLLALQGQKEEKLLNLERMALDNLVQESLFNQEAVKYKISVGEKEINEKIRAIEKSSNFSQGAFFFMLVQKNIKFDYFKEFIKSDLTRNILLHNIISRKLNNKKSHSENFVELENFIKGLTSTNNTQSSANSKLQDVKLQIVVFSIPADQKSNFVQLKSLKTKLDANPKYDFTKDLLIKGIKWEKVEKNLNDFDVVLKTIVNDLKVGKTSNIIQHNDELKIILLLESNINQLIEQYQEFAASVLYSRKSSVQAQKYLDQIKRKAYIRIFAKDLVN
ncbi:MAG: SurA N-terminal domain-containing protein [Rickettsiaceae bacterium]|nr:SurA N-terminal domain-containing protein [Rickettsiaceae bacterium]